MRLLFLLSLAALTACDDKTTDGEDTDVVDTDAGDTDAGDTDGADTDATPTTVLRDCPDTVGTICPFAGNSRDGWNGDGHDRLDTFFSFPMTVLLAPGKPPIVADWNNHKLRAIEDDGTVRTIMGTTFLGDGDALLADMTPAGAQGTDVNLNHPTQQIWMPDGTLLSASWHTHKLRTWDPATGLVHVVLGKGAGFNEPGTDPNGTSYPAAQCLLNQPTWVVLDPDANVWIADMRNERIRMWDREAGTVHTVVGTGAKGVFGVDANCLSDDALSTCLNLPKSGNPEPGGAIAFDGDASHLFIADSESHVIRVWSRETGRVTVLAGAPGQHGDVDATGAEARFDYPFGIAFDADTDTLFVADANNNKIRAVDVTTGAVTTFAGTGEPTCPIELINKPEVCDAQFRAGDGGPASAAQLYRPMGVSIDPDGNVVIADTYNHRLRVVYR